MTAEERVVIVQASVVRAMIKAMGMQAENQQRAACGESPAYVEDHFLNVIDDECIGWNAVMKALEG